jgi:predicted  nucleic acid-binding Zn-ribbon protein
VNEQLGWLIRLQELDTQIDQLREKRERHPQAIEEAKKPIDKASAEYEKVKATYESVSKQKREKERDLTAQEEKLTKLHTRTTEIKTNKEYQAHLTEIEAAKQEKGNLEETLLVLMDQVDQVKKEMDSSQKVVAQEETRFQKEQQRLETEMVAAEGTLKQLEQESKTVAAKIEERHLREYHQLRVSRKGLAVVSVKEGACQGCRLALPPQLFADVRKHDKILTCSHCHRFLFWSAPSVPVESST